MIKVKDLLIIFLFITAAIQIGILWLQIIPNQNFFIHIDEETKQKNYIAENFKLEIKNKENLFDTIYKPNKNLVKESNDVLKVILSKKNSPHGENLDLESERTNSYLIYNYEFEIDTKLLAEYLEINQTLDLDSFDKIFFNKNGEVSFGDTEKNKIYRFSNNTIPKVANVKEKDFKVSQVEVKNPYEQNGDLLIKTIEEKTNCFFDDTSNKEITSIDNDFIFSSDTKVIKYTDKNILEYTNYKKLDVKELDLSESYNTTVNFIKKDVCGINDLILRKYKKNNDDGYDFYFDYIINNVCVNIENQTAHKLRAKHFIHVSANNFDVTRYKKLVFYFVPTEKYSYRKISEYVYIQDKKYLNLCDTNIASKPK